jgi:hypothetical protein
MITFIIVIYRFFAKTEDLRDQWMPSIANRTMGENYLRFYENTLFWVQCGSGALEYRTAEVRTKHQHLKKKNWDLYRAYPSPSGRL